MKRLLMILATCTLLSACSGHQPQGFYGSPFIVAKQPTEKKENSVKPDTSETANQEESDE